MFSGQNIFECWTIGLYIVFFTFLPPVALRIADQYVEPEVTLSTLEHYRKTQKGHFFNMKLLVASVILSFILWILFLPVYVSLWSGLPIGSEMTGVPDQLFALGYLSAYMVFSPLAILFFDIMYTLYCSLSFSKWHRDSRMMPTKFFPEPTSLPCAKCSCYSRLPHEVKMILRGLSRCFPFIHGFYGSCKCAEGVTKVGTPQPSQPGYDEISNSREMKAMKTNNSQKKSIFGTGSATMSSINANNENEDLI